MHNAFDAACDKLDFDIEAIVVKVFKHFSIYTVRVEKLKYLCDESSVQFSMLKSHTSTRFLSLYPAVKKVSQHYPNWHLSQTFLCFQIIELFDPLKEYFKTDESSPQALKNFFSEKTSLFWLHFLQNQLELNNETILRIEKSQVTSFEVAEEIEILRIKVLNRKNQNYIPIQARQYYNEFSESTQQKLQICIEHFYNGLMEYTVKWSKSLDKTEIFSWIQLNEFPEWAKVESSLLFINKKTERKINGELL